MTSQLHLTVASGAVIFLLTLFATALPASAASSYQLNETIEVSTTGAWDKAVVIEVGTAGGAHEGEYKVHFIGYPASYDRWLQPLYFRKVAGGAPMASAPPIATNPASGAGSVPVPQALASAPSNPAPRPGRYNILSFGAVGNAPLFLGHIELLDNGKYRISRKSSGDYHGEGTYSYDAATRTVKWLSGPCKDDGWGGAFTIERAGKTHKIRLRQTTIATSNVD